MDNHIYETLDLNTTYFSIKANFIYNLAYSHIIHFLSNGYSDCKHNY